MGPVHERGFHEWKQETEIKPTTHRVNSISQLNCLYTVVQDIQFEGDINSFTYVLLGMKLHERFTRLC